MEKITDAIAPIETISIIDEAEPTRVYFLSRTKRGDYWLENADNGR